MVEPLLKSSADDLRQIASELREAKDLLREISREILRIERRIKAVLPGADPQRSAAKPGIIEDEPAAARLIEELKHDLAKGVQIEDKLRSFAMRPDLQKVASVLGMTNSKLPPKDELVRRISTRLRQNQTMSHNLTDGPPTAAGPARGQS